MPKTREDRVDLVITGMEDDHPVDIADALTRPQLLRDFTKNANAPQCCHAFGVTGIFLGSYWIIR